MFHHSPRGYATVALILLSCVAIRADVIDLTGGDPGEGLTLVPSNVIYAVDIFQSSPTVIQSQIFTDDDLTPGVTVTYNTSAVGPGNSFAGTSINDGNISNLVRSIGYDTGGTISLSLGGLTLGNPYLLELLVSNGGFNSRRVSVTINGIQTDPGVVVLQHVNVFNYFIATGTVASVSVSAAPNGTYPDNIPTLAGFVLSVPEPSTLILLGLGAAALCFRRAKTR